MDANSEIFEEPDFEVRNTPVLEFNGAKLDNLAEKVSNNISEVLYY
jgi:hypothetical protein